jgi:predicted DCC family thiol-disulfide oxidoreductase YuxK
MGQPLVIFDGLCNFCNYWVRFIIKRDKKATLKFTSLQGETAKTILPVFSINPEILSSVILIEDGKAYTESSAAIRICRHLDGGWKLMYGLIIIPKFLRNVVYNLIARNRYSWFGKKDQCMIPSAKDKDRFLD